MFALLESVLPTNRQLVDQYLGQYVFTQIQLLLRSIGPCDTSDPLLLERARTYVEEEEERIKSNLENFDYQLDAHNTVLLVTGHGRIERVSVNIFLSIVV